MPDFFTIHLFRPIFPCQTLNFFRICAVWYGICSHIEFLKFICYIHTTVCDSTTRADLKFVLLLRILYLSFPFSIHPDSISPMLFGNVFVMHSFISEIGIIKIDHAQNEHTKKKHITIQSRVMFSYISHIIQPVYAKTM